MPFVSKKIISILLLVVPPVGSLEFRLYFVSLKNLKHLSFCACVIWVVFFVEVGNAEGLLFPALPSSDCF